MYTAICKSLSKVVYTPGLQQVLQHGMGGLQRLSLPAGEAEEGKKQGGGGHNRDPQKTRHKTNANARKYTQIA